VTWSLDGRTREERGMALAECIVGVGVLLGALVAIGQLVATR
jgi:hypothetical protein